MVLSPIQTNLYQLITIYFIYTILTSPLPFLHKPKALPFNHKYCIYRADFRMRNLSEYNLMRFINFLIVFLLTILPIFAVGFTAPTLARNYFVASGKAYIIQAKTWWLWLQLSPITPARDTTPLPLWTLSTLSQPYTTQQQRWTPKSFQLIILAPATLNSYGTSLTLPTTQTRTSPLASLATFNDHTSLTLLIRTFLSSLIIPLWALI